MRDPFFIDYQGNKSLSSRNCRAVHTLPGAWRPGLRSPSKSQVRVVRRRTVSILGSSVTMQTRRGESAFLSDRVNKRSSTVTGVYPLSTFCTPYHTMCRVFPKPRSTNSHRFSSGVQESEESFRPRYHTTFRPFAPTVWERGRTIKTQPSSINAAGQWSPS